MVSEYISNSFCVSEVDVIYLRNMDIVKLCMRPREVTRSAKACLKSVVIWLMTKPCYANEFYLCALCRLPLKAHREAWKQSPPRHWSIHCTTLHGAVFIRIFTHKNLFEDLGTQPFNFNLRLFSSGHEAAPFRPQGRRFHLRQFRLCRVTWCHQRSHKPTRLSPRMCRKRNRKLTNPDVA